MNLNKYWQKIMFAKKQYQHEYLTLTLTKIGDMPSNWNHTTLHTGLKVIFWNKFSGLFCICRESAADKYGISDNAAKVSDNLAKVVGQRNVDKLGEITQTALGYSQEEECVCCPCLPASQTLIIIMLL